MKAMRRPIEVSAWPFYVCSVQQGNAGRGGTRGLGTILICSVFGCLKMRASIFLADAESSIVHILMKMGLSIAVCIERLVVCIQTAVGLPRTLYKGCFSFPLVLNRTIP